MNREFPDISQDKINAKARAAAHAAIEGQLTHPTSKVAYLSKAGSLSSVVMPHMNFPQVWKRL